MQDRTSVRFVQFFPAEAPGREHPGEQTDVRRITQHVPHNDLSPGPFLRFGDQVQIDRRQRDRLLEHQIRAVLHPEDRLLRMQGRG